MHRPKVKETELLNLLSHSLSTLPGGGGGLPYETGRDARRLA